MMRFILTAAVLVCAGVLFWACDASSASKMPAAPSSPDGWAPTQSAMQHAAENPATTMPSDTKIETATFAAGCFWGVESTFRKVPGVLRTRVGFTGGKTTNPSYEDVCTDLTGHAESIDIEFDPKQISYQNLLNIFFENHDPTTVDRQGPDAGTQYRSVVFYHSPEQKQAAEAEIDRRNKSGDYVGPIVTQIVAAGAFYSAEEYHQRYYEKQGVAWSCHFGNGKKPGAVQH